MTLAPVLSGVVLFVLIPAWMLAGFADWLCHRASAIERTTGTRESALHLVMLAEGGSALLCGLFLEINAATLALMIALWAAHEATGFWDLRTATGAREITAVEQHIHGYLLVLPLTALSFVLVLHWPQGAALFGQGPEAADFSLGLKRTPLPTWYLVGVPLCVVLLNGATYLEEFARCVGAARRWAAAASPRS